MVGLVICSNHVTLSAVSSHRCSLPTLSPSSTICRMIIDSHPTSFDGVRLHRPRTFVQRSVSVVVKAAFDATDGTTAEPPSSEVVSVDRLPLESKEQEKLEQKARMKLAKKIRLRRKRLVQKRRLRKKGRWPPSKMAKLKNV